MSSTPRVPRQRILQGATAVARGVLRDQDGEVDLRDGLTITATVYIEGVVSGTADRTTTPVDGYHTVDLTAAETDTIQELEVRWTEDGRVRATTHHSIVGGFLFDLATLKGREGMDRFDPIQLRSARDWATELVEHHTGAAWNHTYHAESWVIPRRATRSLAFEFFPVVEIRSLVIDGDQGDLSASEVDIDLEAGVVHGIDPHGVCVAKYVHGFESPPQPLRDAAVVAAADVLTRGASGLSERIRSASNDLGIVEQFSFPGVNHPTGIDFVDAALNDYDQRTGRIW